MKANYQHQRNILQSKFGQNTLIQLVMAIGVGYILVQAIKVILLLFAKEPQLVFPERILPNVALQPFESFIKHPWVIFSYFWGHDSFWNLLSNMLWLYCFGSVIQTLIGNKEIILLYVSSCVVGGLFYLGFTYFWPGAVSGMILTSLPGVVAFAAAAIVLAPKFRFHLGERMAIPLWVVLLIFVFLNLMSFANNKGMMILLAFAALSSGLYILVVKAGYTPGAYLHNLYDGMQRKVSPDPYKNLETKRNLTLNNLHHKLKVKENKSELIDKILDKINQKGYDALTQEEKESLRKASEEIT